jgi:hypothetical protein
MIAVRKPGDSLYRSIAADGKRACLRPGIVFTLPRASRSDPRADRILGSGNDLLKNSNYEANLHAALFTDTNSGNRL